MMKMMITKLSSVNDINCVNNEPEKKCTVISGNQCGSVGDSVLFFGKAKAEWHMCRFGVALG